MVVPAEAAEYKQVTVLFADVVRSMDLAATLDMERWRDIMTELAERSTAAVRRYGGGTVDFTGDGVMAVFGAPAALEDHAFRACLAALEIQRETIRLAAEVQRRNGVALRVRVGLNSGRVIVGETGSLGYAAIGRQVGLAQRMESVAPPGGVVMSASTARLVEDIVLLGEPEWVRIKGTEEPVPARRLLGLVPRHAMPGRTEVSLLGRRLEMAVIEATVDRAIGGRGGVVSVVGPPGIGKSRVAREAAALASGRGCEVVWAFCESHASDIPFYVVTRLLGAAMGITDLDDTAARVQVRTRLPGADEQDLLLLDDLLGIGDPGARPDIASDAQRRRVTTLINAASLGRSRPVLYIIEDAHWVDEVSESMLADFLTVVSQTRSVVLITYRPEYAGALTRLPGAQPIQLAPLHDLETAALLGELLGPDPSVGEIGAAIASRVGGNPFFAEEIVRDLSERGVLRGQHGDYACRTDVNQVSVPATLQAAIGARIDRLDPAAKRTLSAASVIGSRFDTELLITLGLEPVTDELLRAELIDQVKATPCVQYAFRHPLIHAVAYESQLKSARAEWHRRLADAIQQRDPDSAEENAALIAEHLQAAGELRAAYGWHMRSSAWSTNRDIAAARISWERARKIADLLPEDDPGRTAMRIAPRTMLCVSAWRAGHGTSSGQFDELRELCAAAGDKASLAIAMSGRATELLWSGRRARESSRLVSEQMALLEAIGDPMLTIGAAYVAIVVKHMTGEFADALRWSQTVIDLADGDPHMGANFAMGSPLAAALNFRGAARYSLGLRGWREDLDAAVEMARSSDPVTHALMVVGKYGAAIECGVLRAEDCPVREIEETLQIAERSSDDTALGSVKFFLGLVLTNRDDPADRDRGLELITQMRDVWLRDQSRLYLVPVADVIGAQERARRGDRDGAIAVMRKATDDLSHAGLLASWLGAIEVLVPTLLERGDEGDLAEAQIATDQLASVRAPDGWALRDIGVLRLRALLARAQGDVVAHRALAERYRAMAISLGFEGHIAMADSMT